MTPDILLTYAVIVAALVAMAREWLPADLVLLSAMGVLIAGGVVELEEALVGFAEPTLLALGSLFVMAAGLRQTGVLRRGADLLFGEGRRLRSVLFRLTGAASTGSAFLNNTPIVAMGIPAVLAWSREREIPPSKLLIPLSYASILGGVCTLIGTSTNLVADGMLRERGMEGLGFFELGALGLPLAVVGLVYLVVVAPAILGERAHPDTEVMEPSSSSPSPTPPSWAACAPSSERPPTWWPTACCGSGAWRVWASSSSAPWACPWPWWGSSTSWWWHRPSWGSGRTRTPR